MRRLDDDDPSTASSTERLEEKIEHLQQMIKNMSIRRNELWCTSCCKEGHMKETCSLNDQPPTTTDAHRVQAQKYCNICECLTDHNVQDCPHNLKNTKWCHICEASNHKTSEFISMHEIKPVYEQSITQKPPTKLTIMVEEMTTMVEVEVEEAMVDLVVEVEVEDDHTATIVGKMTTSVQISQ
jgi:hypothetical protein